MVKKIFEKPAQEFILKLAEELKKLPEFETPEWALYVKSSAAKERPIEQEDFWYIRAASILRQLYIKGVVGVGKLRTRYGARKRRGSRPEEFRKASGKIIRTILQQAEQAGLVEKVNKQQHGRKLTQNGRKFLDNIDVDKEDIKKSEKQKIDDLTEDKKEIKNTEEKTPDNKAEKEDKSDVKEKKNKENKSRGEK